MEDAEAVVKLLRALATGTDHQKNKHDVIFTAAANIIERLLSSRPSIIEQCAKVADDQATCMRAIYCRTAAADPSHDRIGARCMEAASIAEAIRSLKEKDGQ